MKAPEGPETRPIPPQSPQVAPGGVWTAATHPRRAGGAYTTHTWPHPPGPPTQPRAESGAVRAPARPSRALDGRGTTAPRGPPGGALLQCCSSMPWKPQAPVDEAQGGAARVCCRPAHRHPWGVRGGWGCGDGDEAVIVILVVLWPVHTPPPRPWDQGHWARSRRQFLGVHSGR